MLRRLFRCGGVDDDCVGDEAAGQVGGEGCQVHRLGIPCEVITPGVQGNAGVAEQHAGAAGQPQNPHVQVHVLPQFRQLLLDLGQQGGANEPRAYNADGDGQLRQVEARVHRPQRPHALTLLHQDSDVVLAAALGYGSDVDVGFGEGTEHSRGDALAAGHLLPHRRQDAAVVDLLDVADTSRPDGIREFFFEAVHCSSGLL
mmetsp:Transcript_13793/g.41650  ORF Transcript_13793/g.41650 Transcript_13793/m.41650 type:complete len:201 (-) Transcript_13793:1271-1873(-)